MHVPSVEHHQHPSCHHGLTHRHPTPKDLHFYIETYLSYFKFKLQICGKKSYLYRLCKWLCITVCCLTVIFEFNCKLHEFSFHAFVSLQLFFFFFNKCSINSCLFRVYLKNGVKILSMIFAALCFSFCLH